MVQLMMMDGGIDFLYAENSIYDDHSQFMLSWWGRYSYFNNEPIQIGDI